MPVPALLFGAPCKREVPARCVWQQARWLVTGKTPVMLASVIGNLIWVNRSHLIHQAKEQLKTLPGAVHMQMDSDGFPVTPKDDAVRYVQEDFDSGYGIVIAPVRNIEDDGAGHFIKLWEMAPGARETPDRPWEVTGGSFTQVWFAPLLLQKLRAIETFKPANAQPEVPIYTKVGGGMTEDTWLIRASLTAYQMPACVDPRLKVRHYKEWLTPEYGALEGERAT